MKPKKKQTKSGLAKMLGVSRQLIGRHADKPDAPALDDLAGWTEYLAAMGREGSMPKEFRKDIAEQRIRLLRAQSERLELENAETRKEFIPRTDARHFMRVLVTDLMFGELQRLCDEWPVKLRGKTTEQIDAECAAQLDKVRDSLTSRLEGWIKALEAQAASIPDDATEEVDPVPPPK
jgi:hypothetical protein